MPLIGPAVRRTPEPFVTIPAFLYSSSPRNNYFAPFSSALWMLCKTGLTLGFFCSPPFFQLALPRPISSAHFNSATLAFAAAARKLLSSVASGNPSRRANSRYTASYAVN